MNFTTVDPNVNIDYILLILPVDWSLTVSYEVGVSSRKMMIAEESAGRTQWRRVRRGKNQMSLSVYKLTFPGCVAAPEYEHQIFSSGVKLADNGIGKFFPSTALM